MPPLPRIIPVLDLMNGKVVHARGGDRKRYQPIQSQLTGETEPLAVARALRRQSRSDELYLADLDAIEGKTAPATELYARLAAEGFRLLVDAGLRADSDAAALARSPVRVVAGLETVAGPAALEGMIKRLGPRRVVFSLDVKAGLPLGANDGWRSAGPLAIAAQALKLGAAAILVLDLARVGQGRGTGTEALCRDLRRRSPRLELLAGGGVKDRDDLERLAEAGVDAVLVATALHQKCLP